MLLLLLNTISSFLSHISTKCQLNKELEVWYWLSELLRFIYSALLMSIYTYICECVCVSFTLSLRAALNCNFIWLRLSWISIYVLYNLTIDFCLLLFHFMAEFSSYIMAHVICTTNSILPPILSSFSLSRLHTHTLELQKVRFFFNNICNNRQQIC